MFKTVVGVLEEKITKMETISNLCANKKNSHKYCARGAWCAHGSALWEMNHKGGCKKKVLLA